MIYSENEAQELAMLEQMQKEAGYDEMSETEQIDFIKKFFFETLERTRGMHNSCITRQTETYFALKSLTEHQNRLLLSIKPAKDRRTDFEFLEAMYSGYIEFFDSMTTRKFKKDFESIKKIYVDLEKLREYWNFRLIFSGYREMFPTKAKVLDEVLFELAEAELNHEECRNCDFCKYKTVDALREANDALFESDAVKDFVFVKNEDAQSKESFQFCEVMAHTRQVFHRFFRYYVDRTLDRVFERCDCNVCRAGGAEKYFRIMEKYQNAANN